MMKKIITDNLEWYLNTLERVSTCNKDEVEGKSRNKLRLEVMESLYKLGEYTGVFQGIMLPIRNSFTLNPNEPLFLERGIEMICQRCDNSQSVSDGDFCSECNRITIKHYFHNPTMYYAIETLTRLYNNFKYLSHTHVVVNKGTIDFIKQIENLNEVEPYCSKYLKLIKSVSSQKELNEVDFFIILGIYINILHELRIDRFEKWFIKLLEEKVNPEVLL